VQSPDCEHICLFLIFHYITAADWFLRSICHRTSIVSTVRSSSHVMATYTVIRPFVTVHRLPSNACHLGAGCHLWSNLLGKLAKEAFVFVHNRDQTLIYHYHLSSRPTSRFLGPRSFGHFGTGDEMSGQFGPTWTMPKCLSADLSRDRSVRLPSYTDVDVEKL